MEASGILSIVSELSRKNKFRVVPPVFTNSSHKLPSKRKLRDCIAAQLKRASDIARDRYLTALTESIDCFHYFKHTREHVNLRGAVEVSPSDVTQKKMHTGSPVYFRVYRALKRGCGSRAVRTCTEHMHTYIRIATRSSP